MRNAYFAYLLLALALAGSSVAGINPRASGLSTADQAKLDVLEVRGSNIGPVNGASFEFENGGTMNGDSGSNTVITNGPGKQTQILDDVSGAFGLVVDGSGYIALRGPTEFQGEVGFGAEGSVTVAGGSISSNRTYTAYDITGEGGFADDIDTITAPTGLAKRTLILVRSADAANPVTLKDGTDNLNLGADKLLPAVAYTAILWDEDASEWTLWNP